MSKTWKHKVWHIFRNEDGTLNLKIPLKLRWSHMNKIYRHNYDRDEDRARLAEMRDKSSKQDMKHQINN